MLSKLLKRMNIQFLLQLDKYLVTKLRTSLKMMMLYGYKPFSLLLKLMPLSRCLQTMTTFFVILTTTLQVKNLTMVQTQSGSLGTETLKMLLETTISLLTM
jgi:type III secretory pathway component EscU